MEKINGVKTYRFSEINEPKTKEEFHNNLTRFYVGSHDHLYTEDHRDNFQISKINHMDDLSDEKVMITPTVIQTGDWDKFLEDNYELLFGSGIENVINKWWEDDTNNIIVDYTDEGSFQVLCDLSKEYQNNQLYWRDYWNHEHLMTEFFKKTLGQFSGYGSYSSWMEKINKMETI